MKGSCQDRIRNFIKAVSIFSQPPYFGKLFLRAIKTPVSFSGKNSSSSLMADRLYSVLPSCRAGWIPGQARNDVGLGLGGGCFWIPGQARIDVDLGLGGGCFWIPRQSRNDVGLGLGGGYFWIPGQARNDVGLGVSALRRAPLPLYRWSLYRHFPFLKDIEYTSSRTSPSSRGDIDPGSITEYGLDSGSSPE